MTTHWVNWGRNQHARPTRTVTPHSREEVVAAVRSAARDDLPVKALGAGHSFSSIAATEGVHVRLDGLTSLRNFEAATGEVTVESGMTLCQLNALLEHGGRSLANLGDIAEQTVAGAIATGTHGTGRSTASLAEQVTALELVLADGSIVSCSAQEHPDLFEVARLGLGAFGIVTAVTWRTEPMFLLEADDQPMPLTTLLAEFDELSEVNDHLDVYWWPHTEQALVKRRNRADGPARPLSTARSWLDDEVMANGALAVLTRAGRSAPRFVPALNRLTTRVLPRRTYCDVPHRVLTSSRRVRFVETEWAVPRGTLVPAVRELAAVLQRTRLLVGLPIQMRIAPADDVWLSPAYGRSTAYIAAHVPLRVTYEDYFGCVEELMVAYNGRPHWGKIHTRTADDFAASYPRFRDVVAMRNSLDPDRRFANDYLRRVLGP